VPWRSVHGLKLLDEGANAEKQMSMNKRTRKKLCCKRHCLGRACRHCLRLESLRRVVEDRSVGQETALQEFALQGRLCREDRLVGQEVEEEVEAHQDLRRRARQAR